MWNVCRPDGIARPWPAPARGEGPGRHLTVGDAGCPRRPGTSAPRSGTSRVQPIRSRRQTGHENIPGDRSEGRHRTCPGWANTATFAGTTEVKPGIAPVMRMSGKTACCPETITGPAQRAAARRSSSPPSRHAPRWPPSGHTTSLATGAHLAAEVAGRAGGRTQIGQSRHSWPPSDRPTRYGMHASWRGLPGASRATAARAAVGCGGRCRAQLEILLATGSGDAVEADLEVVAVPDKEVLLVVLRCADP
jgi:hypothetical protein